MIASFFAPVLAHYQILLSLYTGAAIIAVNVLGGKLVSLVPSIGAAGRLNAETLRKKMQIPSYAANHKWNRKWSALFIAVIFGLILPFCLTAAAQPWWQVLLDVVVILMVYDFVYYLTHRFVFHKSDLLDGPLIWMHAVHHQQHNPCRMDSSYIHPLEVAIGLGLYVGTIFVLSRFMGDFHVATVVITFVAFTQINLHNHNLWEAGHFPFGYLNYASKMHHNHHAKFTGGNFATITPLYDWMFGTLDDGAGYRAKVKAKA